MNLTVLGRVSATVLMGGLGLFGLAGCGAGATSGGVDAGVVAARPSFKVSGTVFGGQQAVVGAHVYLMGVTGSGVGANSGSGLPSTSLLNSAETGNLDSVGAYALTDAGGGFSLSGDFAACTSAPASGAQLYLYVLGGNPGAGTNAAAGFLAALGTCGSIGPTTKISVNELSTVAAAYALAGFATSATDMSVGSGTAAQTGLQNAMQNAHQLVGLASGAALSATPNGNGTPDAMKINTLGNILAACVNSTGNTGSNSACGTLFANALSGGSTGTQPTDTATAAIYIAQHPYVSSTVVTNLFNVQATVPPYQGLSQKPSDFTLGIRYTASGLSGANAVVIDQYGDAMVTGTGGSVTEFSSTGVASSSGSGAGSATTEALDGAQNQWYATGSTTGIVEKSSGSVTESPGAGATAGFGGGQNSSPTAVATDGSGDVWVTNADGVSVSELIGAATPVVTPIAAPSGSTPAAGVDPSQPATAETLSQATVVHQAQLDSSLYGHNMAVSDCLAYVSMQNGTATSKLAVVNLCGTDASNVPEPALVNEFAGSYQGMNGITVSGSNLYITYAYATNPFEVWTTGTGGTSPSLLGCVPLFSDQGYTTCGQTSQGNSPALYGGNPYVIGNYVYVAENSDDAGQAVQIIDPSTPSAPVKVSGGISSGDDQNNHLLAGLWAPGSGSVLYVGTVTTSLSIGEDPTITAYDAGQSATSPVKLGNALNVPAGTTGYLIQNMAVQGTTVVATLYDNVAGDPGIILVSSFANPSAPTLATIAPTSGCVPGASNFIAMQNGYAFFGCGSPSTLPNGIEVVNVSNPANPVLVGQIATSLTRVNFIVPEGRYFFAVDIHGNFDTIDTGSLFVP